MIKFRRRVRFTLMIIAPLVFISVCAIGCAAPFFYTLVPERFNNTREALEVIRYAVTGRDSVINVQVDDKRFSYEEAYESQTYKVEYSKISKIELEKTDAFGAVYSRSGGWCLFQGGKRQACPRKWEAYDHNEYDAENKFWFNNMSDACKFADALEYMKRRSK